MKNAPTVWMTVWSIVWKIGGIEPVTDARSIGEKERPLAPPPGVFLRAGAEGEVQARNKAKPGALSGGRLAGPKATPLALSVYVVLPLRVGAP